MEEGKGRGGALAALLAVGALGIAAVPAYGALSSDASTGDAPRDSGVPGFVQDERPAPGGDQRDEDCPFKDGQGRGEGNGGGSGGGGDTPQRGVSSDSASLY